VNYTFRLLITEMATTSKRGTLVKKIQRKRLSGAGRRVLSAKLDSDVYNWVVDQRMKQNRVSYKSIQRKAREIFPSLDIDKDFKASRDWVRKFMKRHRLSLRRKTSVAQKDPNMLFEKLADFIQYSSNLAAKNKVYPANIIAMDETAIFFDMPSSTTMDHTGNKTISLKTTGESPHFKKAIE